MFFAQMIGFAGAAFLIFSFQFKKPRNLFLMQICSNLCYIAHFLGLGAYTGCLSIAASLARNLLLVGNRKWMRWKVWAILLIAVQFVILWYTWQGWISILPCIANIASIIGGWTGNARKIRIANMFFNSPSWLIYDICVFSISGILCEIFTQTSTIISIVRYGWKGLGEEERE